MKISNFFRPTPSSNVFKGIVAFLGALLFVFIAVFFAIPSFYLIAILFSIISLSNFYQVDEIKDALKDFKPEKDIVNDDVKRSNKSGFKSPIEKAAMANFSQKSEKRGKKRNPKTGRFERKNG